ncbi:MAG: hypothetical protein IKK82_11960 [Kiritimatiellae bacterium]|nr:hypothetical protein [Kiritimatiellia bacterium]
MYLYLVSYDLKAPGRNYEGVFGVLKSALSWWHYLESTWIIRTSLTIDEWNDKLLAQIDRNDSLLIIDVTGKTRNGWLNKKAWEWIREQNIIIEKERTQRRS